MKDIIQSYGNQYGAGKLTDPVYPYEKPKEYFLDKVKYFFGMYSYNDTAITWGGSINNRATRRTFKELRDHARGLQDPAKYKDVLDPVRDSGKYKGKRLWNISWQVTPIISKFRNIIKSKFKEIILRPMTTAVDDTAQLERLTEKNKMKLTRLPGSKAFMQGEGYQPDEPDEMRVIETADDVEMLYQMGGIRLAAEMMFKDAIDFSLYESGWETISDMVIEDLIDLNAACVEQYNHNGVQTMRYIDVARVIIDSSIYPDMRDTTFRGYLEYMKYTTLKMIAPDLSPNEVQQIRKRWLTTGYQTSDMHRGAGYREEYAVRREGTYTNEDFGVEVATLYWIDDEYERYIVGRHARGSRQFEKVDGDFELSERAIRAGKTIEEFPLQCMYMARWVVGTDIIFDYCKLDTITKHGKDGSRTLSWPLTIYIGNEPSLIEKTIAFDDDIQLANFKIRNLIAKMAPGPRMLIFKNMIRDSIKIGDETMTIADMIKAYQSEGVMILDEDQQPGLLPGENPAFQKDPIRFLPSGVAEDIQILETRIVSTIDKIRQVTGVNEVMDGTSQNQDMLQSVMKGLQTASNNALRPYVDQYVELYRMMIKHMVHKYQLMLQDGDVTLGLLPVNEHTMRMVKMDKALLNHKWGVMVEVDTTQNREFLLQELAQRKGIPDSGYFLIWNMIQGGDFKKAQYLLAKYTQRAREMEHQQQIEIAQAASMGQAQAAQVSEQAKSKNMQLEHSLKKDFALFEHQLEQRNKMIEQSQQLQQIEKTEEKKKETGVAVVKANQKTGQMYQ